MDLPAETLERFLEAARRVGREGLALCSSGNLSWRIDETRVLLSASRSWLSDLAEEEVALCRLADGGVLNGVTPSVESRFHLGILRARPELCCVLHFQSRAATVFACQEFSPRELEIIPEMPFYLGPVGRVPFRLPGSVELADEVVACLEAHDIAILENHGLVTVGASLEEAHQRAVFFEFACEVALRAGDRARLLPPDAVEALREMASSRRPGRV